MLQQARSSSCAASAAGRTSRSAATRAPARSSCRAPWKRARSTVSRESASTSSCALPPLCASRSTAAPSPFRRAQPSRPRHTAPDDSPPRVTARPRALVVVTGSELVRGERTDRNGPFLAAEALRHGLEPARITIVGDTPAELEAALREGLEADACSRLRRARPDPRRPHRRAARARGRARARRRRGARARDRVRSRARSRSACGGRTRTSRRA